MNKKDQIILLNQYREVLNSLKRFEEKEETKTNEKQKVKVLTKTYKGRNFKVA